MRRWWRGFVKAIFVLNQRKGVGLWIVKKEEVTFARAVKARPQGESVTECPVSPSRDINVMRSRRQIEPGRGGEMSMYFPKCKCCICVQS